MSNARIYAAIALLALAPALTSCRIFRKQKREPAPPPPPFQTLPQPAQTPPPAPLEPPPQLPPTGEVQEPIPLPDTKLPPPAPVKKRPSPAGPRVPATSEPAPSAPSTPAPQLRPMLTQAQRQELERTLRERIGRAQGILTSVTGRNLNRGQRELEGQIRTFIRQAEEARDTDLLRANNLAERAEVLAQDLARRLR